LVMGTADRGEPEGGRVRADHDGDGGGCGWGWWIEGAYEGAGEREGGVSVVVLELEKDWFVE
jgi:hypothetical protein